MTKTALDICTAALVRLGVTEVGGSPAGEDMTTAEQALNAFFDEFKDISGASITWGLDETPNAAFLPLVNVLACEMAPSFQARMPQSYASAIGRLRKYAFPDDRADRRDTDGDGSISADEAQSGLEATYY